MLKAANNVAKRLWQDESGVVLALTVVVFLTLFIMASSVFAVGETVRQRIELQHAADAAAYSGAIVQADTLSRIAAINRAMSWTYVMLVRMEMDAIVDQWLALILVKWNEDEAAVNLYNAASCNKLRKLALWNGISSAQDREVYLNYTQPASIQSIIQARNYWALLPRIAQARSNISAMNAAQRDLINNLKSRIEKTVDAVIAANLTETFNDRNAGGADIRHVCLSRDTYFRILGTEPDDERIFLAHSDYNDGPAGTFEDGIDTWFVRRSGGDGLAREYRQAPGSLVATWRWYTSFWSVKPKVGCTLDASQVGSSTVKGEDGYNAAFYETGTAEPRVLKERFFGRDGAIVVGVRRRLNNPLTFLFAGDSPGIFRAFTTPGAARIMWTAAAARAGYMQKPASPTRGQYEVTFEPVSIPETWNLKTSDWDAVLLPLHRAWADGRPGRSWSGETGGEILERVQAELDAGNVDAPAGMDGGALDTGRLDGWVIH